jgi:hypothetical protein
LSVISWRVDTAFGWASTQIILPAESGPEPLGGNIRDRAADTRESQINITIFLGLLILTVFIMPALGFGETDERWYGNVVSSVLLVAGTALAWHRRGLFIGSAIIGGIALLIRWIAFWNPSHLWIVRAEVATLVAILVISLLLLLRIFRRKGEITYATIQAAISIYLLFGLAWANAYLIVIQTNPHSFQSTVSLSLSSSTAWLYYSYVTLTTLGYGEITPLSDVARVLSIGEALTGQLYLAVLVARLIGMQLITYQEQSARSSK